MTDANDILTALEGDPESVILAAMLTDALMEERDMIRTEADRHVARVQKDARDAIDMKAAADIMSAGDGRRAKVIAAIGNHCFADQPNPWFTLVIVPGDDVLVATSDQKTGPHGWWYEWTVQVPARWIIKTAGRAPHPGRKVVRRRRG